MKSGPLRGNLIDNALTGLMATLALYADARSVSADGTATIFVALALAGTVFSALMGRFASSKILRFDGALYVVAAIVAVYLQPVLNDALPEPVFTAQLTAPGIVSWLVIFGSFVAWRDGTQIFQAVPCISLFGLVGVYNSYSNAVPLFFVLLLCMATLFARIHRRSMATLAAKSGFTRLHNLNEDAWRWMAGPEWALASALAVGLVSLLGAPIVQDSVHRVLGAVPLSVQRPSLGQRNNPPLSADDGVNARIGMGPRTILGRRLFLAELDEARYLRTAIFESYTGRGWLSAARSLHNLMGTSGDLDFQTARDAASKIVQAKQIAFKITPLTGLAGGLPVPGEVIAIDAGGKLARLPDGTFQFVSGVSGISVGSVSGQAIVCENDAAARTSPEAPSSDGDPASLGAPARVVELARTVTKGIKSPYDKAWALKREIERRCKYDLNAPASPATLDPVEDFLFKSQVGYCDLFASSMALMARSVGISARYVVGFYPVANEKDAEGRYVLRDSDMHAWAELYFPGTGWLTFDATEGASAVPGGERGSTTVHTPWYAAGWVIPTLVGVPTLAGLAIGGWALRRSWRHRDPTRVARSQIGRAYESFVRSLQRASGVRREASATPDEYLALCSAHLATESEAAKAINDRFNRAMFSPNVLANDEIGRLKSDVAAFGKRLRQARGNPRSYRSASPIPADTPDAREEKH